MYGRTGATLACHVETIKQSYKNTEAVKLIIAHRTVFVFIIRGVPLVFPPAILYGNTGAARARHVHIIEQSYKTQRRQTVWSPVDKYVCTFLVMCFSSWDIPSIDYYFPPPKSQQKHNTKYWRKRKLTTEWHICFRMRQFPGSSHSVGVSRDVPNFVYV